MQKERKSTMRTGSKGLDGSFWNTSMMMSLSTQENKLLKIKENLNLTKKFQEPGKKAPKKTKKK